jgi:hypothetical protein
LQFAKAGSAATLLQQEKNNSENVQRAEKYSWLHLYSSKLALAAMPSASWNRLLRLRGGADVFQHLLRRLRARHKTSPWAIRQPFWGQTYGGVRGEMTRIAPARPAAPR